MATYNRIAIQGNETWAHRESTDENYFAILDVPDGAGVTVHSFDPIDDNNAVVRLSIVEFIEQYEDDDDEEPAGDSEEPEVGI